MSLTIITILCISLTSVVGIFIGSLKFKGIGLGVGGVLFAGLLSGYCLEKWNIVLNPEVLAFLKEFGLIMFIYSMGLTVGPNIFASLRKNGLTLNLISEYAGYASYSSFYTAYMNFYGRSPVERLREVREDKDSAD